MGRVGRFILKVAAVLILIVSAGTFALSLFTGETRNGDNLQSEFDYLITVGISQSGEESSWKDANTASFMDTFVKSNGYEAVYADAGSDQEKQIEDVEGFYKTGRGLHYSESGFGNLAGMMCWKMQKRHIFL